MEETPVENDDPIMAIIRRRKKSDPPAAISNTEVTPEGDVTQIEEPPIEEIPATPPIEEVVDELPEVSFDELTKDFKLPEIVAVEAPLTQEQKDYQQRIDELTNKVSQYENDPILQLINYAPNDPQVLKKIAKELAGEDYSNHSYEQLLRMDFERQGLTGEFLEDAVADELENYNSTDKLYKKTLLENQLRAKFPTTSNTESPTLKSIIEAQKAKQKEQPSLEDLKKFEAEQEAKYAEQELAALRSLTDKLIESKFHVSGVVFDKSAADQVIADYNNKNIAPYIKDKGQLDVVNFAYDRFWRNARPTILAEKKKVEDNLKRQANPERVPVGAPPPAPTDLQKRIAYLRDMGYSEEQLKKIEKSGQNK